MKKLCLNGIISALVWMATLSLAPAAETGGVTNGVSGRVIDAAGQPLAGATVEYFDSLSGVNPLTEMQKGETVTTGADGAFAFPKGDHPGVLVARKAGLAPAWLQWGELFNAQNNAGIDLVLTTPGKLAGLVLDESKQPVAKVEVSVALALANSSKGGVHSFAYLPRAAAHELFAVRTDAAGHFVFENFPTNAGASLTVDAPGKAVRPEDANVANSPTGGYRAGDSDITLNLEPAGGVEGKVVCAETGQLLPKTRVALRSERPGLGFMATHDGVEAGADGAFRLENVPAGNYRIWTTFGTNVGSEWVAVPVSVTVEAGQVIHDVKVTVERGTLLEVALKNSTDHQPLADVNVSAFRQDAQGSAVSGTDGLARLHLLPGDYQISAYRGAMAASQTSTTVTAGQTNRVEIEVEPAQQITGTVHGPDGRPAVGISVQMISGFGANGAEVKTDADGKFAMDWNPRRFPNQGTPTACVLVREVDKDLAAAADVDEDSGPVDLKLAPGLTLVGKAECDGKPLTNVTGTLVFWSGNSGRWMQEFMRANTPGRYEITTLPPGRKYGVVVSAPGYGQKQLFNFEVQAEPGRQELETVELRPANLVLAGQVVDTNDKPVPDCNVNLNGEDQPNANTRTDRQGRFHFDHVCDSAARLFANTGGGFGNVSAVGGDTNVVLRLGENAAYGSQGESHELRGHVTDADGKPVAGAELAVFPEYNNQHWSRSDTDGNFRLRWTLQPWQAQNGGATEVVARDLARDLAVAVEIPDGATNMDVKLKPAQTVTGLVKKTGGAAMPGAEISLQFKVGNMYGFFDTRIPPTDAAGHFQIKGLPADSEFLVVATTHGYGRSQQTVTIESDAKPVELSPFELKPADQVIAGQVLKSDDKPASGANVNINGEGQPAGNVTTDSKGRFHFQVCEGQIQLYAYSQDGGNGQATASAGDTNIVINLSAQPGGMPRAAHKKSLNNSTLPDLTTVGLAAEVTPVGKPVLLCLFDASQRPSRHMTQLLNQLVAALGQKGVAVVGVQAAVLADDAFNDWKTASPVSFPVGRVADKSAKTAWAANPAALPWLVLADANHKVVAEGFSLDELDAQIQKLTK